MHTKTIVITGGAGYIGSRLTIKLMSLGHRVIIIDNLSGGTIANLPKDIVFYNADICSGAIYTIFEKEKPDMLFHMAASKSVNKSMENPKEFHDINVVGSANVFAQATKAGIKRIIFTSTAGVYGNTTENTKQKESDKPHPSSIYAETKLATEQDLLAYINKGTEGIILRFANVYGPGGTSDVQGVVELFAKTLLRNEPITIFGDGTQTRDFIYTDDLISLCEILVSCDYAKLKNNPIINVSTGESVSVLDILHAISNVLHRTPQISYKADAFIGQRDSLLDPTLANSVLGWSAKTSLSEGIQKTVSSFTI
jgi:UDP-glucose 4-epimerase